MQINLDFNEKEFAEGKLKLEVEVGFEVEVVLFRAANLSNFNPLEVTIQKKCLFHLNIQGKMGKGFINLIFDSAIFDF